MVLIRNKDIKYDLKNSPLRIKTISDFQSTYPDQMIVNFYTPSRNRNSLWAAGGINIKFGSPPQYKIINCRNKYAGFDTDDLPTETEKTWEITKTETPGLGLTIFCNSKKVLEIQLSDSICTIETWQVYWGRDVKGIKFSPNDKASEFFFHPPGKQSATNFMLCGEEAHKNIYGMA